MKSTFFVAVTGCALSLASLAVSGQTVANGPYYATPSWDQTLPAATRFVVLSNMQNNAVLDRETGLVWEKAPSTDTTTWYNSLDACAHLNLGGRRGWRLPSVHELSSLIDTSVAVVPQLPVGHPFTIVAATYWTASIRINQAPWVVNLTDGNSSFVIGTAGPYSRWCVRGGQNHARDY
jgi:hypothetical protein